MSLQDPFNHTGLFTKCSGTKIPNGVSSKATNERTDGVKLFDIPAKFWREQKPGKPLTLT